MNSTTKLFDQGSIEATGVPSDMAIVGSGFFRVIDPVNSNQFLTRNGSFRVDSEGFLANQTGKRVLGLTGGTPTTGPDTLGLIRVDIEQKVKVDSSGNPIDELGRIILSDGTRLEENDSGDFYRVNEAGDLLDSESTALADSILLRDIGGTSARAVTDATSGDRFLRDDSGDLIDEGIGSSMLKAQ